MFPVPGIISAMEKYEDTKTCENYLVILDKVEKLENVKWKFYVNMIRYH